MTDLQRSVRIAALAVRMPETLIFRFVKHQPQIVGVAAQRLTESGVQTALEAVRDSPNHDGQAMAFTALIPRLRGELKQRTIHDILGLLPQLRGRRLHSRATTSAVRERMESARTAILVKLAPELSEDQIREVVNIIRTDYSDWSKVNVIAACTPYATSDIFVDIVAVVKAIEDEKEQGRAIEIISAYVPESLLDDLIALTLALPTDTVRSSALNRLWLRFSEPLWVMSPDILRISAARTRQQLLSDLCVVAAHFHPSQRDAGAQQMVAAVQDVGRWWP